MNKTKQTDIRIEREVANWMDRNFYARIQSQAKVQRTWDKRLQFRGCDIMVGKSVIDEKCKYRGLRNKIFQYLSFELSFIGRDGRRKQGWFAKDGMATTHYAFISVFTTAESDDLIREENITKTVVSLVSKKDVWQMVKDNGDDILADATLLRRSCDERKIYPHGRYWLKHSTQL